ncbi:unnamed protein product [Rotaria socialis]|uniref:Uncharacterized protein n=2 Tax=Rotaria socialis TaxID=392032 RepID=A0A817Y8Y3_9BILA|nr:unnamed protein product [Rotaria socialis]
MNRLLSMIADAVYDSKRKEFLGRDSTRWGKLAIFYFFFYFGLAGFFSTLVFVFMRLVPLDRPRYHGDASCMQARGKPLAPGLGFRPQIDAVDNTISVEKNQIDRYVKSLHQYLLVYYWKYDIDRFNQTKKFTISDPGDCTPQNQYGFASGKPCILVKINKIIGFEPKPGYMPEDEEAYQNAGCRPNPNAISIHCTGESAADTANIQNITYISENGHDKNCGSLDTKWFPYQGKIDRQDVYQAPYIWVQFNDVKPNVPIKVICRIYAENINYNKLGYRALTQFELIIKN